VAAVRASRTTNRTLETNTIEKRRKHEKNELRRSHQKHVFRELKEENKNT